jgi:hypothetical protein
MGASTPESSTPPVAEAEPEPPPPAPTPGTLRLVVIHPHPELLGSEAQQIGALEAGLRAAHLEVTRETATGAESAWLDAGGALPDGWATYANVVVLRLPEPQALRSGRRMAQGLSDLVLVRPPATEPVFADRGEDPSGLGLVGADLARWIATLIAHAPGEGDEG